jgi:hypothetical protein
VGVHVAAVPLVGPFEAAERALGRLYPDQLALHTVVILEDPDGTCTAYDFLPLQPTEPLTISRWVADEVRPHDVRTLPPHHQLPILTCCKV